MKLRLFIIYYLRSMRLYYSFITGTTVLAGILSAHGLFGHDPNGRDWCIGCIGFLAWGVNQIFSDYCDLPEDRINAPHRPMVTGDLPSRPALLLSAVLMLAGAVCSWLVSPWLLAILAVGGALNILYSKLKRIPVLNCFIYGCAITSCFMYGFIGSLGCLPESRLMTLTPYICAMLLPAHVLMCSFSYYKDKDGDRAAGIRTLQNLFPDAVTIPIHLVLSLAYTAFLVWAAVKYCCYLDFAEALALAAMQSVVLALLAWFLMKKRYHRVTCLQCVLCMLWCCSFIVCWDRLLILLPPVFAAMIFILFLWYPDDKE